MLMILIAIIVAAVVTAMLFWWADREMSVFPAVCALGLAAATASASLMYAVQGWNWFAAEHKARILNQEYGTHYTAQDVFWASDVIDTIRELDRKRIEVNGDLMRDQPSK